MKTKSRTITEASSRKQTQQFVPPVHPGEVLRDRFMLPLGLSCNALALALQVPATRISEIVKGRRGISGDSALRLGVYFRTTAEFWMNLQSHYDLEVARTGLAPKWEQSIKPAAVGADGVLLARTA